MESEKIVTILFVFLGVAILSLIVSTFLLFSDFKKYLYVKNKYKKLSGKTKEEKECLSIL